MIIVLATKSIGGKRICPECESGLLKGMFTKEKEVVQAFKRRGECKWKIKIKLKDPRDYWRAKNIKTSDPFKSIILLALQKARRPLSTSEVAKRTRMDWATAKTKLVALHKADKVNFKKIAVKRVPVREITLTGPSEKRVPSKILWSTRKINL